MIKFIIVLLTSFVLFAQIEPDSVLIKLTFSESMDATELYLVENYKVVSNFGDTVEIYAIGNIEGVSDEVVILTNRLSYDSEYYTVYVDDVYDLARNKINFQKRFVFFDYGLVDLPSPSSVSLFKEGDVRPLKIVNAWASKISEPENVPANVYDNDTTTVWTAKPIPQWIVIKLNRVGIVGEINIAFNLWYQPRIYTYNIDYSVDNINWVSLFVDLNSNINGQWNVNTFSSIEMKFIKVTTVGNDRSEWANIREINFKGE